jgi:shikimate kinase
VPSVDLDDCIEATAGRTIRQIFEDEGETGFREREQQALAVVAASRPPSVIALGGGAILRAANQQLIRTTGHCIWLQGSAAELLQRISADSTTAERRPQLSRRSGYDEVVEILAAREPIYSQLAQLTVSTDHRSPDELVLEIVDWLESADK